MSVPHPVHAFAGLTAALLLCGVGAAQKGEPQPPPAKPIERPTLALKLTGPYTHDNLTIFLIHGDDRRGKYNILVALVYLRGECPESVLDMTLPDGRGTRHAPLI